MRRRFEADPHYDGFEYHQAFRHAAASLADWLLIEDGEALDLDDEEIWGDLHLAGWRFPAAVLPDLTDVLAAAREIAEDWLNDQA